MSTGAQLIAAERQRQIDVEGWTPEHDDEHVLGEMAGAAESYAFAARCQAIAAAHGAPPIPLNDRIPNHWPPSWHEDWYKPSDDSIRNLVKAGALIAAEIDRRLPPVAPSPDPKDGEQ